MSKRSWDWRGKMAALFVYRMLIVFCLSLCLCCHHIHCSVTYDRKALLINGQRRILFSGSIHYPRSTPDVSNGSFAVCVVCLSFKILMFLVSDFFCWLWILVTDVGRSYTEGKRWRSWCDWNLCFLECAWAVSWKCNLNLTCSLFSIFFILGF